VLDNVLAQSLFQNRPMSSSLILFCCAASQQDPDCNLFCSYTLLPYATKLPFGNGHTGPATLS
jgi:hypothetical protein